MRLILLCPSNEVNSVVFFERSTVHNYVYTCVNLKRFRQIEDCMFPMCVFFKRTSTQVHHVWNLVKSNVKVSSYCLDVDW